MTLTQLEYFCSVCRYHSITRAAEELFVSQPTISIAIRDLEQEFHLRLFNHGKNRISLTEDGEAFYKKAEHIVQQSQDMLTEFAALGQNVRPLRIGIPPLLSTVFFPRIIDQFHAKHEIPVELYEYGSSKACSLVDSEELDLALVNMDFYNIDKFNHHVMMEDHCVFCVSRTHRFADRTSISISDMENEPILLFNTDSFLNQTVNARFRALGITPEVLMHSSQLYTILNFVRGGNCGAFLYSTIAVNPRDFVEIPIEPDMTSKFGIIWKKGVFIPNRLNKFIDFIKSYDVTAYLPKKLFQQ